MTTNMNYLPPRDRTIPLDQQPGSPAEIIAKKPGHRRRFPVERDAQQYLTTSGGIGKKIPDAKRARQGIRNEYTINTTTHFKLACVKSSDIPSISIRYT